MRFSVKIIACVALAAAIVTTAFVTLAFFPLPESSVSHMFDVYLVYAYAGKINVTEHSHFGMNVHSANIYPVFIVMNYTYLGIPDNEPYDAKFEGYLVKLVSDTGVSASYTAYEGLELNQSSSVMPAMPNADTVSLHNMTVPESFSGLRITDSTSFTSGSSSLGLWSNGEPSTITLTLQRVGWWTAKNGSVSTITNLESDEVLLQVQLEVFGDGFLYNKLVPEDKLGQADLFDPLL